MPQGPFIRYRSIGVGYIVGKLIWLSAAPELAVNCSCSCATEAKFIIEISAEILH